MTPSYLLPEPEPGLVVRFGYRWADDRAQVKDRPVCVVLVSEVPDLSGGAQHSNLLKRILYVPISTKPPRSDQVGLEIPRSVAANLRLRDTQNWVVLSECNVQFWPNDLARVPHIGGEWVHGYVPPRFFDKIRDAFVAELTRRKVQVRNVSYLPPRGR